MIIKITPDKEKAKSILEMVFARKKTLEYIKKANYSTIIAENYYEIIKELLTATLLTKGKKTFGENSHKELITENKKENILNEEELILIDTLRIKRNKSSYQGKQIPENYLKNNEKRLKETIKRLELKLKELLK